jgi:hypothetical protein
MSAEIEVPDGPEACGPTCAIQLLGVEVQHATRETEVTLPDRPALSCFGSGGPARSPSIGPLAPRPVHVTAVEQGDLRRPVLKAVGGEASWKTSDFDQAADRYNIDFSRGVRDVAVRQAVTQVPAHCQDDHVGWEAEASEGRLRNGLAGPVRAHCDSLPAQGSLMAGATVPLQLRPWCGIQPAEAVVGDRARYWGLGGLPTKQAAWPHH